MQRDGMQVWTDADEDQSFVLDIVVSVDAQQICAATLYVPSRSCLHNGRPLLHCPPSAVQEHSAVPDDAAVAFYFQDLAQQNEAVQSQLQLQTSLGEHGFSTGKSLVAAHCRRINVRHNCGNAGFAGHLCS